MNIFKKLASFALLAALVGLSVLCNVTPSHAEPNAEAISYDAATKTLTIQGDCDTDQIYGAVHGSGEAASLETLHFAGTSTITTKQKATGPFDSCTTLKYITADEDAHVSFAGNGNVVATLTMFFIECSNLISLDGLSVWDISGVSGSSAMQAMFQGCSSLISLEGLSGWDVSSVSGDYCMTSMFYGCSDLTSLDALSSWKVSGVSGNSCMYGMFGRCSSLASLDGLCSWDVSGVNGVECMAYMFVECTSLTSIDGLSNWNIDKAILATDGVIDMFRGCDSLAFLAVGIFKLNSSMNIPSSFADNINIW